METYVSYSFTILALLALGCNARPGRWTDTGPKRANAQSLRFLVMGDWGGLPDFPYRTPIEKAVAKRMGEVANNLDTQFLLALGDNFYFDGVKDVDDKRFYETFESIYTAPALMRPWYLVAGNHDWNGNASAQIAYSQRSARWKYPSFYYLLHFDVPGSKSTVEVLMIDTIILCGNSDADRLHLQPSMQIDESEAEKQWAWIEQTLRQSKADYLLVAGHYPVYSIAEHGNTKCLLKRLKPMLHKYRVTAYVCGHEHNLQHIEWTDEQYNSTVHYIVTGAANFIDPKWDHHSDMPGPHALKFYWGDILHFGAFNYLETTAANMTFQFVRSDGRLLHQLALGPRKQR